MDSFLLGSIPELFVRFGSVDDPIFEYTINTILEYIVLVIMLGGSSMIWTVIVYYILNELDIF